MKNIKIIFHEQPGYYIPGATVRGVVNITADKPDSYKKIIVGIFGRAHVLWSSGSGDSKTTYHNSVTYVNESSVVWNMENSQLAVGEHTYPFEYQLPENIPASFESHTGQVRYEIYTEVSLRGLFKGSIKDKATIQVRDVTDHLSLCMEPKAIDMSKRVNFLCFDFGTASVTCNLPHTGFSPGDTIPINLHIENQTTKVVRVRSLLCIVTIFTSRGGTKRVLSNNHPVLMTPEFQPGAMTSFEGGLKIPAEVRTTYRGCTCISVEYAVVLKVIATLGSSMDMNIPIVIANNNSLEPV